MRKNLKNLNFILLFFTIAYSILGLVMILSASSPAAVLRYKVPSNYFFLKQLRIMALGYIAGLIIINIPTKKYTFPAKLLIYLSVVMLVLVLLFGVVGGGAKGWWKVGASSLQPLEFVKTILILYMAIYYNRLSKKKNNNPVKIIYPLLISLVLVLLVMLQPDMGGAFILSFISALIFFSIPLGKKLKKSISKLVIASVIIVLIGLTFFGKSLVKNYQASRFNFSNPCSRYSEDTGYQVCNGYIAINNGGLGGTGLGSSTQKYLYLPEAHTDFIFAIIAEELGLILAIVVVIGYFIMLFTILNIAKEATVLRNSIIAYGVFAYLLSHILINLLGVLGLIPLTGVPLPLLSFGGSYCLNVLVSLFLVQRVNIENKTGKQKEKIKNL